MPLPEALVKVHWGYWPRSASSTWTPYTPPFRPARLRSTPFSVCPVWQTKEVPVLPGAASAAV